MSVYSEIEDDGIYTRVSDFRVGRKCISEKLEGKTPHERGMT